MDWILRQNSLEKVLPFVDKSIVKVITGIRRCGKSVMMELIQKELLHRKNQNISRVRNVQYLLKPYIIILNIVDRLIYYIL
jgi:predicted AAA+ superfamily ATPase